MNFFSLSSSPPPEETMLLPPEHGPEPGNYRWGIIGMRDHTLGTLIPPGSVVQIDIQSQVISPGRDWPDELQRPLYFLRYRDALFCSWCELDVSGERLTLVPHPLSPASNQSWGYPGEVEILGRVVAVSTPHNVVPSSPAPST